jgi:hypothetical protein
MNEKRITTERRTDNLQQERLFTCNRRMQPDRRLNNIKVEWIPVSHINIHPVTRLVFSKP